jgi:tartrate dehydrogenase/decarboxylase/D-malate dehydrogenase
MMLDYLGQKEAAQSIESAIEKTLGEEKFRTKDLGGKSNTIDCSNAIRNNL